MHTFHNNLSKNTRILLFYSACFSLVIYFKVYPIILPRIEIILGVEIPNWIKIPSYLALYHVITSCYEKYLWKYDFIKVLGLPTIPDLNGDWAGDIQTSHDGFSYQVEVEIHHTLSKFLMILRTVQSSSETNYAYIEIREPKSKLHYYFTSRPSSNAQDTMQIHDGTGYLEISRDGVSLSGNYYTGRGRESFGDINLTRSIDARAS